MFAFVERAVSLEQMLVQLVQVFFGKEAQHVSRVGARLQKQDVFKSSTKRDK